TPPAYGGATRPPVPPRVPRPPWGPGQPESSVCRLLFFGIVRPYKGLDVLLRALARGPGHLRLTVAGEFWGGTGETEKLIAELGIGHQVRLRPGYLPADEIPALFAAADALVLPYREATASQNALLAFAHGVPVITTTAGALGDLVRDGVDGLTCAPGDTDGLVRALAAVSAPGAADRLRAGIREVDPEPCWAAYLQALPMR
nr:glycosyltransferase [Actinomycetota bacterium]